MNVIPVGYVVGGGISPALTFTALPPRSPFTPVSPLPASLGIATFQDPHNHHSPSPRVQALVLATPTVNPLVALDSHQRVHYEVSKDPANACAKFCGRNTPITREQKSSLMVEGALHGRFRIIIDHPILTRTIKFESPPTVGDFLKELYSHFQERVGSREMTNLEGSPDDFIVGLKTQMKRCKAADDFTTEWKRGMKRVDILGEECKFRGIYLDSTLTPVGDYLALRVVFNK